MRCTLDKKGRRVQRIRTPSRGHARVCHVHPVCRLRGHLSPVRVYAGLQAVGCLLLDVGFLDGVGCSLGWLVAAAAVKKRLVAVILSVSSIISLNTCSSFSFIC